MNRHRESNNFLKSDSFTKIVRWYFSGTWAAAVTFAVVGGIILSIAQAITGARSVEEQSLFITVIAAPFVLPLMFKIMKLVFGVMAKA